MVRRPSLVLYRAHKHYDEGLPGGGGVKEEPSRRASGIFVGSAW